jgi:hypothetical protein
MTQNDTMQSIRYVTYILLLLLFAACGPDFARPPYEPPRDRAVQERSRVTIEALGRIGHYTFSHDRSLLIIDGTVGKSTFKPATVMVLSWPNLEEIWRYEHDGKTHEAEHPYVYQWQPDNSGIWIAWTPSGRLMHLDLASGIVTESEVAHLGVVLSPDGRQMIGWGRPEPDPNRSWKYNATQIDRLFVYNVEGPTLDLTREIAFPDGGAVTGLYWSAEPDQLWVVWTEACDWLSGGGQFNRYCEDRALWQWSFTTDTFTPYWPELAASAIVNEPAHALNHATRWLLTTDVDSNLVVLDLSRRCPILRLKYWHFGQHAWYDTTSFVQVLNKEDNERPELAIYEPNVLASGRTPPCLAEQSNSQNKTNGTGLDESGEPTSVAIASTPGPTTGYPTDPTDIPEQSVPNGTRAAPSESNGANTDDVANCASPCLDGVFLGQLVTKTLSVLMAQPDIAIVGAVDDVEQCVTTADDDETCYLAWRTRDEHEAIAWIRQGQVEGLKIDFLGNGPTVGDTIEQLGPPELVSLRPATRALRGGDTQGIAWLFYREADIWLELGWSESAGLNEAYSVSQMGYGLLVELEPTACTEFINMVWRGFGGEGVYFDSSGQAIDPIIAYSGSCFSAPAP